MQTACLNLVMMNSHQLSKNLGLLFKSFQIFSICFNAFQLDTLGTSNCPSHTHPATRQQSQTTGGVESWLERFTKHGQPRCYLQSPCRAYSSVYICGVFCHQYGVPSRHHQQNVRSIHKRQRHTIITKYYKYRLQIEWGICRSTHSNSCLKALHEDLVLSSSALEVENPPTH